MELFRTFTRATQGVRRGGAAAADLCHVAAGLADGFWYAVDFLRGCTCTNLSGLVQAGRCLYRLVPTCTDLCRLIPTCRNLSGLVVQTCTELYKLAKTSANLYGRVHCLQARKLVLTMLQSKSVEV